MAGACRLKSALVGVWKSSGPCPYPLHILVGRHNVVNWRLVIIYMRVPPTHYYLESSGRAATWEISLIISQSRL